MLSDCWYIWPDSSSNHNHFLRDHDAHDQTDSCTSRVTAAWLQDSVLERWAPGCILPGGTGVLVDWSSIHTCTYIHENAGHIHGTSYAHLQQ